MGHHWQRLFSHLDLLTKCNVWGNKKPLSVVGKTFYKINWTAEVDNSRIGQLKVNSHDPLLTFTPANF